MSVRVADRRIRLFAVLCALGLPGCAQITVVSGDQPPKSELHFGVLAVDLAPAKENTLVSASGLGLISTPSGTTLGYTKANVVRMGDECRVVIAVKDSDAIAKDPELLRLLRTIHKACPT